MSPNDCCSAKESLRSVMATILYPPAKLCNEAFLWVFYDAPSDARRRGKTESN